MTWKKGVSGNPKGKPKGSKDKFTSLKQSFLDAFQGIGGTDELKKWATDEKHQKDFFKMIATMLPRTVEGKVTGDLTVNINTIASKKKPKGLDE
jgi:hypothetical protein